MKTAIIVLNYNDYNNTSKFVNLVKDYDILLKIIVVDNLSTDNNYDKLKDLENEKVSVFQNDKNSGYASGNNFGLEKLDNSYDYCIISNSDVFVDEDTIKQCIDHLEENKDVAIVAPRMCFENGQARRSSWRKRNYITDIANSTRITEVLLYYFFKKGEYTKKDFENEILQVDNIAGSFFIARKDIFNKVNYFDENTFLFYEEDILGYKIKEKGYKIVSLNGLKFIHYDSQTIGKIMNIFKKQKLLFASRKYYQGKYNNINKVGLFVFDILYCIRCLELLIEIPVRKLLQIMKKV